jgi:hypothetical protein
MPNFRLSPRVVVGTIDASKTCVKETTMDLSSIAGSIAVRHGQPLRLDNTQGRRLHVLAGHVWVTQDSDPRDVVLGAGEEYVFDRPRAIASALDGDARIVVLFPGS